MPIHILDSADPLSDESLRLDSDSLLRNAQSGASRVLRLELTRYCRGEVNGRSFLIAGHRGAGKTTMVADALDRVLRRSRQADQKLLRPLPIFLHGPSLFETESAEPDAADKPAGRRRDKAVPSDAEKMAAESRKMAAEARVALKHIILGIHRAVVREFSRGFRERLEAVGPTLDGVDLHESRIFELAAQFEIELAEDPSAQRLREFWEMAGALHAGVLFARPVDPGQGMRELVALNGMCNAHQRISGELSAQDKTARSEDGVTETSAGAELRGAEFVKPVSAVVAGAAVAAGSAAGSHSLGWSLVAGLAAALVSSVFVKTSTTTTQKRGRQTDTTFIPDLSLKTLDRILPTLIQRLRDAGLAPVLVIDELDKVRGLPERLVGMIHFLKKLLAENVFTCFLTDRGYLEHLRLRGNGAAYGPAYSYFSHPLLIAYLPCDFDAYLDKLLKADRATAAQADPSSSAMSSVADADNLDLEVLKWVLRHRSQLHALALARQIAALRGENATVQIASGVVRTEYTYRIDVTFQVAIELQLAQPHVQAWLRQRPDMSQTLFDALYYLSRHWLQGSRGVVRGGTVDDFHAYLVRRMNLEGVGDEEITPALIEQTLTQDDRMFLDGVLRDLQGLLGPATTAAAITARWDQLPAQAAGGRAQPGPTVLQCLLVGPVSLLRLVRPDSPLPTEWRYWPSGVERAPEDAGGVDAAFGLDVLAPMIGNVMNVANQQGTVTEPPKISLEPAFQAMDRIKAIDDNLWRGFLRQPADTSAANGEIFELLGDRTRLLPTTPAWSRVKTAIANLEQRRLRPDAGGNPTTLMEDVRAVEGFARMLDECTPTIGRALLLATLLGAVRDASDDVPVMSSGLVALAAGLGFAGRDVAGIDGEFGELKSRIVQEAGPFLDALWQSVSDASLSDASLASDATIARSVGAGFVPRVPMAQRIAAAWTELESRLDAALDDRLDVSAGIDELICSIFLAGPARFVGLDLKAMTLKRWTSAFLRAASVDTSPPDGEQVPPWLIGHALNRLGGPSLQAQELESLLGWAIGERQLPPALEDRIHHLASRLAPHEAEPDQSQRIAVCVTTGDDAPMGWWTRSPRRGVALVIEPADLMAVLTGPARRIRGPYYLAVAQGRGIRLPERDMREVASTNTGAQLVWVYRNRLSQMLEPSLVDPQTADEVFDHMMVLPSKK